MIITVAQAGLLASKLQTGQSGAILAGVINALNEGEIEALAAVIAIMLAEDDDAPPPGP